MKLQETLYRKEGQKEYREGREKIDWSVDTREKTEASKKRTAMLRFVNTNIEVAIKETRGEV